MAAAGLTSPFVSQRLRILASTTTPERLDDLARFADEGRVVPVIERGYSLDEVPVALRHFGEYARTRQAGGRRRVMPTRRRSSGPRASGQRGAAGYAEIVLTPPVTPKKPVERIHHGDVYVDDYEWLRDKDDPAVLAHLHEENAYTNARTEHLAVLREQIFDEIKARTRETDLSVPTREGDWWYYTRTVEGSSTASTAARRSPPPTTGRRPTLDEDAAAERPPGRADPARRQRRGRGPRVLLARQLRRQRRRHRLL